MGVRPLPGVFDPGLQICDPLPGSLLLLSLERGRSGGHPRPVPGVFDPGYKSAIRYPGSLLLASLEHFGLGAKSAQVRKPIVGRGGLYRVNSERSERRGTNPRVPHLACEAHDP